MRERFEVVSGARVKIMRAGEGPALLFLHGAGGAGAWTPFMETLSRDFDLIVPQHPGYDESDTPAWLDSVADLAFFYLDFIETLGLSRLHLVGTSIGGWIAAEIAIRDCHALRALTLVAPAGLRLKGVPKADIFMLSPQDYPRLLFHDPQWAEGALALKPTPAEIDAQLKNRLATARLGWSPRLFDPDLHKWLHRVSAPTQIVWGEHDRIIPAAYGPEFRRLIPGSRLEIIPDCSHLPHVEKADDLARRIVSFSRETWA